MPVPLDQPMRLLRTVVRGMPPNLDPNQAYPITYGGIDWEAGLIYYDFVGGDEDAEARRDRIRCANREDAT